jgi:hypothetical protein
MRAFSWSARIRRAGNKKAVDHRDGIKNSRENIFGNQLGSAHLPVGLAPAKHLSFSC